MADDYEGFDWDDSNNWDKIIEYQSSSGERGDGASTSHASCSSSYNDGAITSTTSSVASTAGDGDDTGVPDEEASASTSVNASDTVTATTPKYMFKCPACFKTYKSAPSVTCHLKEHGPEFQNIEGGTCLW